MSGIIGLGNGDGRPVDIALLQKMTRFMAYRGPDVQEFWAGGAVGLGHALLRTTPEQDHQPCHLRNEIWITADARVDERRNLLERLRGKGRRLDEASSDAQLILHAYDLWSEECLQRLQGDFSFCIWDSPRKRFFCARDRFGVKPFFFVSKSRCFLLSNTRNCLRLHPLVSDRLNEMAIADFLLFGFNHDQAATVFADIECLPPGHYLLWSEGKLQVRRYWSLPFFDTISYRRPEDYELGFLELLQDAVKDRLRCNCAGVMMSGGLDSTSIGAVAKHMLAQRSADFDLRAYTVVYDRLFNDEERYYSGLAAQALGIPIHYLVADDFEVFQQDKEGCMPPPEPGAEILWALLLHQFKSAAAHSRILLNGNGGDPGMHFSCQYFRKLLISRQWAQLAVDAFSYLSLQRRIPLRLGRRLANMLRDRPTDVPYPIWLEPDFAERLGLQAKWQDSHRTRLPSHAQRPGAYESLNNPIWTVLFEYYDPGASGSPVEVRYPFFDLRVMGYLLALPPVPWCVDKTLLRRAMRNMLPDAVLNRAKAPLGGDPLITRLMERYSPDLDNWKPHEDLDRFVRRDSVPKLGDSVNSPDAAWINVRPLALNYWLNSALQSGYK